MQNPSAWGLKTVLRLLQSRKSKTMLHNSRVYPLLNSLSQSVFVNNSYLLYTAFIHFLSLRLKDHAALSAAWIERAKKNLYESKWLPAFTRILPHQEIGGEVGTHIFGFWPAVPWLAILSSWLFEMLLILYLRCLITNYFERRSVR